MSKPIALRVWHQFFFQTLLVLLHTRRFVSDRTTFVSFGRNEFQFLMFCVVGDSLRLITGSYNGLFYVCDAFGSNISQMGAAPPNASPRNLASLDSSQKGKHLPILPL